LPERPTAAHDRNQMEGRAAVASLSDRYAATTERGPPDHLETCVHNAHMLRRKGLKQLVPARANYSNKLLVLVSSLFASSHLSVSVSFCLRVFVVGFLLVSWRLIVALCLGG